ncbi:MAG TPA: Gfo/Idh/MocA family oxidoreductase [Gemmatimonadaceae bacterium]|nr:Gfo/Idh/MocA family oxidoreductase [Gemmatimonadaceae bacterium]
MLGVGVIGYGYWGPNLVRNFFADTGSKVLAVCDRSPERLAEVGRLYPGVATTTDPAELFRNPQIDAVAIATPVATHFQLAMDALRAGKHVLVEKPIASTSSEAAQMIDEAARRDLVLLVDHTFVFTGAVNKIREVMRDESFGRLQYYDSTRVNLGLFQHDVNVMWDLAVHDLSIMAYVMESHPVGVSATGLSHVPNQPANLAFLTCFFADNIIAHINVNWLSPVKIRRTLVGGSKRMIVYDDLETSEKVKIYDKGITVTETPDDIRKLLISYRTGDLWSPKVNETEALRLEATHFRKCIEKKEKPITPGEAGLAIVKLLEAADESMKRRGEAITI